MSDKKDVQQSSKKAWYLVDAKDQVRGRLAVRVEE